MPEYRCFVMMPFVEPLSSEVFETVQNASATIHDYDITVERADVGEPINIVQLETHITSRIEQAHFCVAEISSHNPNVLLEVGVAMGRDKPVVLMVQKGAGVPADLQGRYWFEYDQTRLDAVPQRLAGFMRSALNEVLAAVDKPKYAVTAYRSRETIPIPKLFEDAHDLILITTTNLTWFVETGAIQAIAGRLSNAPKLRVHILVMEPESEFAGDRARQLGLAVRDFRRQLREALDATVKTLSQFGDRCEIATYSEFPTQITVIVDGTVLSGVVSAHRRGRENVVIEFALRNAGVRDSFIGHMKKVWERAELVGGGKPGLFLTN